MPRTLVVHTTMLGAYGTYGANLADITMAAADVGNKQYISLVEGDILIAHNTGAGAQTVTIDSVASPTTGRTGSITTYSIGIGEYAVFGPFRLRGWGSSGLLNFEADSADVLFGVLRQA